MKKNMLFKHKLSISSVLLIGMFFLFPQFVFAQTQTTSVFSTIGFISQIILGILGLISLALIAYGIYIYISAAEDPDQVDTAKKILIVGGIGLGIILLSFIGITVALNRNSSGTTVQNPAGTTPSGRLLISSDFPIGILDAHYPDIGQVNVPRNTNILISFSQELDLASVGLANQETNSFALNNSAIKIVKEGDDINAGPFVNANISLTPDNKTLTIDPIDLLGSAESPTIYSVILTSQLSFQNGDPLFNEDEVYQWQFEVGTTIDTIPPQIESIIPLQGETYARNIVLQVNFTEAMNPETVIGDITRGFDHLLVKNSSGDAITGRYIISNQFKTVEFFTNDACSQNSCGHDVFCLPANEEITLSLKAASISSQPPTASFPFDGLTDASSNSFDGNKDGVAQGAQTDSLSHIFFTNNRIDTTAPQITEVFPNPFSTRVPLDSTISATFSKPLLFNTITRQSFQILGLQNYTLNAKSINNQSIIEVNHNSLQADTTYTPAIGADVKDLYQNCYYPCKGPQS